MWYAISVLVGVCIGWVISVLRVARDADIHVLTSQEKAEGVVLLKLKSDEVVYKKPQEGYVFVCVTPDTARRLVSLQNVDSDQQRAKLWNQLMQ